MKNIEENRPTSAQYAGFLVLLIVAVIISGIHSGISANGMKFQATGYAAEDTIDSITGDFRELGQRINVLISDASSSCIDGSKLACNSIDAYTSALNLANSHISWLLSVKSGDVFASLDEVKAKSDGVDAQILDMIETGSASGTGNSQSVFIDSQNMLWAATEETKVISNKTYSFNNVTYYATFALNRFGEGFGEIELNGRRIVLIDQQAAQDNGDGTFQEAGDLPANISTQVFQDIFANAPSGPGLGMRAVLFGQDSGITVKGFPGSIRIKASNITLDENGSMIFVSGRQVVTASNPYMNGAAEFYRTGNGWVERDYNPAYSNPVYSYTISDLQANTYAGFYAQNIAVDAAGKITEMRGVISSNSQPVWLEIGTLDKDSRDEFIFVAINNDLYFMLRGKKISSVVAISAVRANEYAKNNGMTNYSIEPQNFGQSLLSWRADDGIHTLIFSSTGLVNNTDNSTEGYLADGIVMSQDSSGLQHVYYASKSMSVANIARNSDGRVTEIKGTSNGNDVDLIRSGTAWVEATTAGGTQAALLFDRQFNLISGISNFALSDDHAQISGQLDNGQDISLVAGVLPYDLGGGYEFVSAPSQGDATKYLALSGDEVADTVGESGKQALEYAQENQLTEYSMEEYGDKSEVVVYTSSGTQFEFFDKDGVMNTKDPAAFQGALESMVLSGIKAYAGVDLMSVFSNDFLGSASFYGIGGGILKCFGSICSISTEDLQNIASNSLGGLSNADGMTFSSQCMADDLVELNRQISEDPENTVNIEAEPLFNFYIKSKVFTKLDDGSFAMNNNLEGFDNTPEGDAQKQTVANIINYGIMLDGDPSVAVHEAAHFLRNTDDEFRTVENNIFNGFDPVQRDMFYAELLTRGYDWTSFDPNNADYESFVTETMAYLSGSGQNQFTLVNIGNWYDFFNNFVDIAKNQANSSNAVTINGNLILISNENNHEYIIYKMPLGSSSGNMIDPGTGRYEFVVNITENPDVNLEWNGTSNSENRLTFYLTVPNPNLAPQEFEDQLLDSFSIKTPDGTMIYNIDPMWSGSKLVAYAGYDENGNWAMVSSNGYAVVEEDYVTGDQIVTIRDMTGNVDLRGTLVGTTISDFHLQSMDVQFEKDGKTYVVTFTPEDMGTLKGFTDVEVGQDGQPEYYVRDLDWDAVYSTGDFNSFMNYMDVYGLGYVGSEGYSPDGVVDQYEWMVFYDAPAPETGQGG